MPKQFLKYMTFIYRDGLLDKKTNLPFKISTSLTLNSQDFLGSQSCSAHCHTCPVLLALSTFRDSPVSWSDSDVNTVPVRQKSSE